MQTRVLSPRRDPRRPASGGDDVERAVSPARESEGNGPMVGTLLVPVRLKVGRPVYAGGNLGPTPSPGTRKLAEPEAVGSSSRLLSPKLGIGPQAMNRSSNIAILACFCQSQGCQSPNMDWSHGTAFLTERSRSHPLARTGYASERCRRGNRVPQASLARD